MLSVKENISIIAAVAENDVIGKKGGMAWHLPDDLRYFKKKTMGKTVIMGAKTYKSLGKPLPGRKNIVLSRDRNFSAEGVQVIHSIDEVLDIEEEIMVIGGGEVYRLFEDMAKTLYLTRVHAEPEGDAFFEPCAEWEITARKDCPADERHKYSYSFLTLERG